MYQIGGYPCLTFFIFPGQGELKRRAAANMGSTNSLCRSASQLNAQSPVKRDSVDSVSPKPSVQSVSSNGHHSTPVSFQLGSHR